jgi:myosin heavy subunit
MASEYKYLNQSECLVVDGVDDGMEFHKLVVIQIIMLLLLFLKSAITSFVLASIILFSHLPRMPWT